MKAAWAEMPETGLIVILSKIPFILALHCILESAVEDGQHGEKTLEDFTK